MDAICCSALNDDKTESAAAEQDVLHRFKKKAFIKALPNHSTATFYLFIYNTMMRTLCTYCFIVKVQCLLKLDEKLHNKQDAVTTET